MKEDEAEDIPNRTTDEEKISEETLQMLAEKMAMRLDL